MLRIRLFRIGKKHQPSFKIVVVDKKRASKGGRFVDELGFINPLTKEKSVDKEKAKHWISKGAQPSDTVHNLLVKEGVIEGKKIDVHKKSKNPPKADPPREGKEKEAKPSASAPAEATADKEEKPSASAKAPADKEEPKKETE